nr:hypothetical protein BaRGS_001627 [Batillaria attramentaria]
MSGKENKQVKEERREDNGRSEKAADVTQFDYVLMGVADMHEYGQNANGAMMPQLEKVYSLKWSSTPGRSIGYTFCSMIMPNGQPDPACTRNTAQRQLDRLDKMGMKIMSAFECEFMVFEGGDVAKPMGKGKLQYANLDLLDEDIDFFLDLMDVLRGSGLPVELLNNEYDPGQYEITMQPTFGMEAADSVFLLRYGVRAFSKRRGNEATFMARPAYPQNANGFHLNHSLWTRDGQDVFFDASDPEKLSSFARHWLAGLLHHAPAICALVSPTVNCYQRLHEMLAPSEVFWSTSDRLSLVRVKSSQTEAYLENRVPSSACNPYLALAATIAAGLDGVERKLACPPQGRSKGEVKSYLPKTMAEGLGELEKDTVLKEAIGTKVVEYFISLKRDFEVKHFENNSSSDMSRAEVIAQERKYYMPFI